MTNSFRKNNYEQEIIDKEYDLCFYCNQPNTQYDWCQNCNSKRFQQNFDEWTSGNGHIDGFIREAQFKARNQWEVLEWIPYEKLRNVQFLAQGGFSIIYKAIWLDGNIEEWNDEKQKWKRYNNKFTKEDYENAEEEEVILPLEKNEERGIHVVLKSLNNSSNIHEDFLNKWNNYLQFIYSAENNHAFYIQTYGITQDPKTLNYMIVLQEMKQGSLRSNLLIKKYNPNDKYQNLYEIASSFSDLHRCNLVHGDFHSGNLFFYNNNNECYIGDFGLIGPADQSFNSDEIYGVLPYIAPEVLRGKPYTKAADIYSFGIVMWEFTSGIPAFNDVPHDFNLSLKICKGHRPKIIEGIDPEYTKLMERCWSADPNERPIAEELKKIFDELHYKYYTLLSYDRIQVPENEFAKENHPLSCYTSRIIDYSARLNELLNQEELSSKTATN